MKHNPGLGWSSSFSCPNLILLLLFRNTSSKNKKEIGEKGGEATVASSLQFFSLSGDS
jgi:hypothetical protein